MADTIADGILESYCTDSRVHALINDPTTEGIDKGGRSPVDAGTRRSPDGTSPL